MMNDDERASLTSAAGDGIGDSTPALSTGLTCCQRLKLLLSPIRLKQTLVVGDGDVATRVIIGPEAFRMWFYLGLIIYTVIAGFVSLNFSDLDLENNPIYNQFGYNSICVYFDFAPFSYFSAPLWVPQMINLLLYEVFDHFRIYDDYADGEYIGTAFYVYYTIVSVLESLSFIFFINITAVTPFENMYFHSAPFVLLKYALWSMAFKRFLYLKKSAFFESYNQCLYYSGWLYVILLLVSISFQTFTIIPNLFGAHLWTMSGLEWTRPASQFNGKVELVLIVFVPLIIYFFITNDVATVELIINRHKKNK